MGSTSFIYSRLFAWRGAFGVIDEQLDSCFVSNEFPTFTAQEEKIDVHFLKYWFRLPFILKQVEADCTGSTPLTRNRYKENFFLNLQIPLPPLTEQQRIVAKIERLAGKIEEAHKLRIQAKNEAVSIISSVRNKLFTKLSHKIESKPLDSVSESRLGKMLSQNQSHNEDGTPYIRNANVQWGYFDLSSIYRMHVTEDEKEKFSLQAGDILICEGGDIGKAAIWDNEISGCIYQKALHRLRVNPNLIKPKFMLNHIFWAAEQGHFAELKTQTTIAHLTGVKLKTYPVFIPTLEEQRTIITLLEDLQDKVDKSIITQTQTAAELDAMLPSILDQAFKGKL